MQSYDRSTELISIHALREEGDPAESEPPEGASDFYPRPPRGGRQISFGKAAVADFISIHALREEGDHHCRSRNRPPGRISIHALREEGDLGFAYFHRSA